MHSYHVRPRSAGDRARSRFVSTTRRSIWALSALLIGVASCAIGVDGVEDMRSKGGGPGGSRGSGGGASAPSPDKGSAKDSGCASGTTACGELCVDTSKDPANCGGCGRTCPPTQVCSAGTCATTCGGGTTKCGGECVDTTKDPAHCGVCGKVCGTGEACVASTCESTCPPPTTKCGAACVDTSKDAAHCGVCGKKCGAGEACVASTCETVCAPPTTKCGAACVDTSKDAAHCGACGKTCGAGEACVASACQPTCPAGKTKCGATCVETSTDAAHCGGCDKACADGETCTAGKCDAGITKVTFPSTTSSTRSGTLGAGGGGKFYRRGDYVEQSFSRSKSVTKLSLKFKMSDYTDDFGCFFTSFGSVGRLTWKVFLNGTEVGGYSWTGGSGGDKTADLNYAFASIDAESGKFTIRMESQKTVCTGGGSWNWYAGGTATME